MLYIYYNNMHICTNTCRSFRILHIHIVTSKQIEKQFIIVAVQQHLLFCLYQVWLYTVGIRSIGLLIPSPPLRSRLEGEPSNAVVFQVPFNHLDICAEKCEQNAVTTKGVFIDGHGKMGWLVDFLMIYMDNCVYHPSPTL